MARKPSKKYPVPSQKIRKLNKTASNPSKSKIKKLKSSSNKRIRLPAVPVYPSTSVYKKTINRSDSFQNWNGWQSIYFTGTEFDRYADIYKFDWDFSHFLKDITSNTKWKKNSQLYIYGQTEPSSIESGSNSQNDSSAQMVYVPVLIVSESESPPPDSFGLASIQLGTEEIISSRSLRVGWSPVSDSIFDSNNQNYYSSTTYSSLPSTFKVGLKAAKKQKKISYHPPIHFLTSKIRASRLAKLDENQVAAYSYAIPYLLKKSEFVRGVKQDVSKEVNTLEGTFQGHKYRYHLGFNTPQEYAKIFCKQHNLNSVNKVEEHFVKLAKELKSKGPQLLNQKMKVLDQYSEKELKDWESIGVYKYYPQNNFIPEDIRCEYVNRYYGRTENVYPPIPEKQSVSGWQ